MMAAPEPEIVRSPLMDIFTRLEQITENAKTQQAFRNGEFVLFVIDIYWTNIALITALHQ